MIYTNKDGLAFADIFAEEMTLAGFEGFSALAYHSREVLANTLRVGWDVHDAAEILTLRGWKGFQDPSPGMRADITKAYEAALVTFSAREAL